MKLKSNVAVSENGFIFNPTTGESYTVNPIGLNILQHLKNHESKDTIISNLTQEFETDITAAEKDYEDFSEMLKKFGLVE